MLPRFYIEGAAFVTGHSFELPEGVARHVQVLRMQPGQAIRLFDGLGNEHQATISHMGGRKSVSVEIGAALDERRELPIRVTLAMGMPANDRMDSLVEKAAELGVWAIQPLICARSVLRLDGERALKKVAHWQAVAAAACEQSGRAVVPRIHPIQTLQGWLKNTATDAGAKGVLSLRDALTTKAWLDLHANPSTATPIIDWAFLSGPEGGLAPEEEALALESGWGAVSLGRRVLRADTAPLAILSVLAAHFEA